jgi:hypothetical protein
MVDDVKLEVIKEYRDFSRHFIPGTISVTPALAKYLIARAPDIFRLKSKRAKAEDPAETKDNADGDNGMD